MKTDRNQPFVVFVKKFNPTRHEALCLSMLAHLHPGLHEIPLSELEPMTDPLLIEIRDVLADKKPESKASKHAVEAVRLLREHARQLEESLDSLLTAAVGEG